MILQALKEYYDRKAADPDSGIAPLGWEWKEIPYLIVLRNDGSFVRVEDTQELIGKKKRAKTFLVPSLGESKGSGVKSNFPWENAEYIFGIPLKQDKNNNVPKRRQEFIKRLEEYASFDWAKAILCFLKNTNVNEIATTYKNEWSQILKGSYMLFSINGIPVSDIDSFKKAYHSPCHEQSNICIITGLQDITKQNEPPIKGSGFLKVSPTQKIQSELHIVSFNLDAFCSFRKERGMNAPIGQMTSLAYTTALNDLLSENSHQKILVGDATTVFWSSRKTELEDEFADMFLEPEKDNPDKGVEAIERLLSSVKSGAFEHDNEDTRFYVLGLAPNSARIAVRFWHAGTVAEMEKRFADWFENLRIIHGPKEKEHLSLGRLLISIARPQKTHANGEGGTPLGKSENVPPNLAGAVMRSILEGTSYPATLLSSTLVRIKATRDITYPQAKLIKAFLTHNLERKLTVSLDKNNTNVGYRLGRLFAVLERIQQTANPGINATIRDRFYASASSTPAAVFGNLMRLKNHHLAKLTKTAFFEGLIGEILYRDKDNPGVREFPTHLSLQDQGMFALGYYHQRQDFFAHTKEMNETEASHDAEQVTE